MAELAYPEDLNDALREILGMPNFQTGPIARAFRAAGHDIAPKMEAEQAFVMHWLIKLALEHGENWRDLAAADLDQAQHAASLEVKGTENE